MTGTLRLKPGPHPTKRKLRFLARYWATLCGFRDRLSGTMRRLTEPLDAYHRGRNRAGRWEKHRATP